jgi:hypothetical protein
MVRLGEKRPHVFRRSEKLAIGACRRQGYASLSDVRNS